jgi:hypothetical protein
MMQEARPPVAISLPEVLFTALDRRITENHGMGFSELATERPADAYLYVCKIAQILADEVDGVMINHMNLTRELDGEEAVRGAARKAIERSVVDTDIKPVDVVISVFGKPRFRDIIREQKTAPVKVITLHVEPPNLAF